MFIVQEDEDKYGRVQYRFYVNQGDSFGLESVPTSDGKPIDLDLVYVAKFKIYEKDSLECVFCKPFERIGDKLILNVTSAENELPLGKYKYEVEYTLVGGAVNTTNQYLLDVIEQAIGGCC